MMLPLCFADADDITPLRYDYVLLLLRCHVTALMFQLLPLLPYAAAATYCLMPLRARQMRCAARADARHQLYAVRHTVVTQLPLFFLRATF